MKARFTHINFQFKFPAGTSRGVLLHKPAWFLLLEKNGVTGIGECSVIPGLSIDPAKFYQTTLEKVCRQFNEEKDVRNVDLSPFPSIAFGVETALLDLKSGGTRVLFQNKFSEGKAGIPINGLVWMGDKEFMTRQVLEKIDAGYKCIKLKVGALDFDTELEIIADIRKQFSPADIEIRLDANGAFTPENALPKLDKFSKYHIHSVEQPIKPRQWDAMADICKKSAIPVALDEELIGIPPDETMLKTIRPAYIILKPSLIGGFAVAEKWMELAEKNGIGWWITSALESNIGLNAIAQWSASLNPTLPQGLGTGRLYRNNLVSPLEIRAAALHYNTRHRWELNNIL